MGWTCQRECPCEWCTCVFINMLKMKTQRITSLICSATGIICNFSLLEHFAIQQIIMCFLYLTIYSFNLECCKYLNYDLRRNKLQERFIYHNSVWFCSFLWSKWVKGVGSYSSKLCFLFHLKNHHSQRSVNFKFQLKQSSHLDVWCNFVYYSCLGPISYYVNLIIVTITRHIFISIFQTEYFSAVKLAMGYDKNMSFLVI